MRVAGTEVKFQCSCLTTHATSAIAFAASSADFSAAAMAAFLSEQNSKIDSCRLPPDFG